MRLHPHLALCRFALRFFRSCVETELVLIFIASLDFQSCVVLSLSFLVKNFFSKRVPSLIVLRYHSLGFYFPNENNAVLFSSCLNFKILES